jgi:sirohydrochlorin cobaltochelatase
VFPLDDRQALSGSALPKIGPEAGQVAGQNHAIPLLCMEACNHIVSYARKVARENHEKKAAAAS